MVNHMEKVLYINSANEMIELGEKIGKHLKPNMVTNMMFVIDRLHKIRTKKNEDMAFLTLTDDTGSIDGVMFPKTYLEYKDNVYEGKVYIGDVKVDNRDGKMQVIINKLFIKK